MHPTKSTSTHAAKPEAAQPVRPAFAGAFSGGGASGGLFVDVIHPQDKVDAPPASPKA
jgi:hypothetical protein